MGGYRKVFTGSENVEVVVQLNPDCFRPDAPIEAKSGKYFLYRVVVDEVKLRSGTLKPLEALKHELELAAYAIGSEFGWTQEAAEIRRSSIEKVDRDIEKMIAEGSQPNAIAVSPGMQEALGLKPGAVYRLVRTSRGDFFRLEEDPT